MNLEVPPQLEAKLARLAEETGRDIDEGALVAARLPDAPRKESSTAS